MNFFYSENENKLDICSMTFTYGPDNNREETSLSDGTNTTTRYYAQDYEKTLVNGSNPVEVNYVPCGGDLVAMYVNQTSGGNMYYVYSDQVSSILTVTDGTNTYNQSFDAWGNYRSATDGSYTGTAPGGNPAWLYRGYTGHEHLAEMQLINANGRLYDPFINSMLSPDAFVQDPGSTQNYNRYNYCMNNPLKYNDPSGFIVALVGALAQQQANFDAAQRSIDRWEESFFVALPSGGLLMGGGGTGFTDGGETSDQTGNTGVGADGMGNQNGALNAPLLKDAELSATSDDAATTIGEFEGPVEYMANTANTYTVSPTSQDPTVSDNQTISDVYVYGDKPTSSNTANPWETANNVIGWTGTTAGGVEMFATGLLKTGAGAAGVAATILNTGYDVKGLYNTYKHPNDPGYHKTSGTELGINATFTGISIWGGPPGWAIGGIYGGIGATIGWQATPQGTGAIQSLIWMNGNQINMNQQGLTWPGFWGQP